jgi:tetratricopeptide (TPR) repeat protein
MPRKPPVTRSRRPPFVAVTGIWLLAFVLYLPNVGNEFTFDDGVIVARNPAVQEWGQWKLVFFSDYWPGGESALYRPLTILSFAVQRAIHGSEPGGFHLVNVILHALVSVLVLLIAWEVAGSGWAALLAAALFAVHPVHTEVVSSVVGRAELLSSLLALWTFWICLCQRRDKPIRSGIVAGVSLLFFLALCAKENVIVLPVLLLLWELSRRTGQPARARLQSLLRSRFLGGLIVAAAAFLLLRMTALGSLYASLNPNPPFVENPLAHAPAATRALNAVANQAYGLRLHVFPHPLLADYSYLTLPMRSSWLTPGFLIMAGIISLILAVWVIRMKGVENLAFTSSWYVVAILPAGNIVFAVGTIFGERLFYFPSVGFCLCAAVLWQMAAHRVAPGWTVPESRAGRAVLGAVLAVLLALSVATWLRNPAWKNDLALFRDAVAKAPLNAKARLWLGDALVRSGNLAASVAEYQRALEIYPEYAAAAANLIVPLQRLERLDEAIETGEKARQLFPTENSIVLYNLALVHLKAGNSVRFLEYMQQVLQLNPQYGDAHLQMGMYYLQHERNGREARKYFREAIRLNPNSPQAPDIRRWLTEYR